MTWDHFLYTYEEWWTCITFTLAVLFVLYYGFAAPWYKTPFGRTLIAMDLGLAVATFPGAMQFMFGYNLYSSVPLVWVTIIIGLLIPVAILYRIITLWDVRHSLFWRNFIKKRNPK